MFDASVCSTWLCADELPHISSRSLSHRSFPCRADFFFSSLVLRKTCICDTAPPAVWEWKLTVACGQKKKYKRHRHLFSMRHVCAESPAFSLIECSVDFSKILQKDINVPVKTHKNLTRSKILLESHQDLVSIL